MSDKDKPYTFSMSTIQPLYFVNYWAALPNKSLSPEIQGDRSRQFLEQQRIPRPRNAFILYRQELNSRILKRKNSWHSTSISKIAGALWKAEPAHIQDIYRRKADEERVLHSVKYPGYTFKPKKKSKLDSRSTKPAKEVHADERANCVTPPSRYVDDSILDAFSGEMELVEAMDFR